jgi:hypothetical protein
MLVCFHTGDKFAAYLIAHLQKKHPELNSCVWSSGEVPLLPSVARSGITIEVGPIAHSTANSALYLKTKILLGNALEYLEMHNRAIDGDIVSCSESIPGSLISYERVATIGYPRNSQGNICALIHPSLQGAAELNGGTTIKVGDPIFENITDGSPVMFTGFDDAVIPRNYRIEKAAATENTNYRAEEALECSSVELYYPMFINEAAYNEKDIDFVLMRKIHKAF